jgi:hypothetical protein
MLFPGSSLAQSSGSPAMAGAAANQAMRATLQLQRFCRIDRDPDEVRAQDS